jgi:DNA-binding NtrC family response regulator
MVLAQASDVRRILVVEDEPDVGSSLRDLLSTLPDGAVEVAPSFLEGQRLVRTDRWDLVISDERLPDGRGVDILAEAARFQPRAKRVLMTAYADYDTVLRAANKGHIHQFIEKPWDSETLLASLEKLVSAR